MFFGGERYSLLIVSKSEKFDASLRAMLPEGVFDPVVSVSGLATAKRTLLERTFDLVLINGPLPEDPGMRFAVDISRSDGTAALLLVRPVSGSGALAVGSELMAAYGADSYIGRVAAVMLGCTETTFYTISVYFGSAGIRDTRHTVFAALLADFTGFFMACLTTRLFLT